jgi:hypothetical protein
MFDATQIKAGMEVSDTAGRHIGIVDHIQDDSVMLSSEGFSDDLHHLVPLAAVTQVEGSRVTVEPATESTVEAMAHGRMHSAGAGSPLFGTSGVGTGSGGSGRGEY